MEIQKELAATYADSEYVDRPLSLQSAERIVPLVLDMVGTPESAVDFGCGIGTWGKVIKDEVEKRNGRIEILGLDGEYVMPNLLIGKDEFRAVDLKERVKLDRRYGLAVSLEVAEHLEQERSESFVEDLTDASDLILFSAGTVKQPGDHHVNCQWMSYWAALFQKKDYVPVDCIRPAIWNMEHIAWWYKNNMILFVKRERLESDLAALNRLEKCPMLDVIHPEYFLYMMEIMENQCKKRKIGLGSIFQK